MRKSFLATAALAALALSGAAHAASPVDGVWRTPEGDGLVEIRACGSTLCGYLIDDAKLRANPAARDMMNPDPHMRGQPMMDMLLLAHFTGGPQAWSDGVIYNPANGKTYVGELHLLDPARLKVTGCLVKPLCGSQVWKRVR